MEKNLQRLCLAGLMAGVLTAGGCGGGGGSDNKFADLTITKSHVGSFSQGQAGLYTVTVNNIGNDQSYGLVTVKEQAPTGMTVRSLYGTGWTCDLPTTTCTRSDSLANGGSFPLITISVDVAANAASTLVNSVTVSGGNDAVTTNNSATDSTTINTSINAEDVGGGNNDPGYDATVGAITFNIHPTSNYTYTIIGFASGDRIVFDAGTAVSTINVNGADHVIDVNGSLNGNSVTVHLTSVAAVSDAAIFGNNTFRTVFGADSLLPLP